MQLWTESGGWGGNSSSTYALRRYINCTAFFYQTGGRANGPRFSGGLDIYPLDPAPSGDRVVFFVRVKRGSGQAPNVLCVNQVAGSSWGVGDPSIAITSAGELKFSVNQVQKAISGVGVIPADQWVGIAMEIKLHESAGSIETYVDGAAVAALTNASLQTSRTGVTTWDHINTPGSGSCDFCDMYICDGTNASGNEVYTVSQIPDVRVDYRPADGAGYSSGFTPSAGSNYQNVDEYNPPDDDTTYNQASAPAVDGYTVADAPTGIQVIGVSTIVMARKTDAGVASIKNGIRVGSTNYMSAAAALSVTYRVFTKQFGVKPSDNSVWTESGFNALEAVVERP